MAGLIRKEDIDEVRARTDIREIVEGYVTLKGAGIGAYKGLCPFHDERTPSFNVRPQMAPTTASDAENPVTSTPSSWRWNTPGLPKPLNA